MAGVGLVARLLLCLYLTVDISLGSNSSSSAARHRLHIGAFFDLDSADGLGTRPAARLAVEEINNSTRYLRDYELVLVNKSTKGLLSHTTQQLYEFLHKKPTKLMLLAPFSGELAKTVAAYAGLQEVGVLQFSYGATAVQLSSNRNLYPLFFRTAPTEHVFNEPRLEFVRHFKWTREIGLLFHHSPHYTEINNLLHESLKLNGIQVSSSEGFTEDPALPLKTLKENGAHVIIGTFSYLDAKKVLCQAYKNGMYGENYVWLLTKTPTTTSDWWAPETADELSCTRAQFQTVLEYQFVFYYKNQIDGTMISGKTTRDFDAAYRKRVPISRFRSAHAPYAYEAVWAMAQVLEAARPTLKGWGKPLQSLGYGDKDVTALMLRKAKKTYFVGPSGQVGFESNGNRRCEVFIGQFRSDQVEEVGEYSFHPATLTLGSSTTGGTSQVDRTKYQEIHWPAGKPYEQTTTGVQWAFIHVALFIVVSVLAGVALLICVFCLLGVVALRNHRVIENCGFTLTILLIVGCASCLMAIVLFGLDGALLSLDTVLNVCKIRTWLLSLGFTLCLTSFLSKIWFAYHVLERRPKTITKVPWLVLNTGPVLVLTLDVILLTIWTTAFAPRVVRSMREIEHPRPFYEETVMVEQCVSDPDLGALAILVLPKLLLLLIGAIAGWTTRMVYITLCSNTRACALCLGIMFLTCLVEVPVVLKLREYPNAFYGITGLVTVTLVLVLLAIIVVPQLRRAWHCRKRRQLKKEDNLEQHNLSSSALEHACAPTTADWQYMISGLTNNLEVELEPRVVVEKELVYVEPEKVATSANETQTEKATLLSKSVLTDPVEEPEPERPEVTDVTMQTDEEPVTPVSDAHAQTVGPETIDSLTQTVEKETRHTEVQADETEAPPMDLFPDDVSDAGSCVSTASTASQSGKKRRKSRFAHIKSKVDTNLSEERKLTLPTKVVVPRVIIQKHSNAKDPDDV